MKPLTLLCALSVLCGLGHAADTKKPNILIILADDMGYGDTGFNGCKDIPTPAIDSIARNGVLFSAGYVTAPQCAPSRAGLLSGRYQNEFGCEVNNDIDKHGIPVGLRLFGDYLHPAGYRTGLVGKWHLGESPESHPNRRGFDEFFGFVTGGRIYDCDQLLATPPPEKRIYYKLLERNGVPEKTTGYLTTVLGRECADFIHRQKDQPWFLYAAFNAPHTPLQATPELLDRVKHISDKQRRTYAAMVVGLDDAVGKILAQLKADGLEERTLVVFLSDNGGPTDKSSASNAPLRGVKGDTLEGGIRVPFAMQWKGVIPADQTIDSPVSSLDLLPTAMAAAGTEIPNDAAFAGMNLLPLLTGKAKAEPRTLMWRFPMRSLWAVRQGEFKLVKEWPRGQSKESPSQKQPEAKNKIGLYQLSADIAENNDLSASQPEKRKKLQSAYDAWTASLEKLKADAIRMTPQTIDSTVGSNPRSIAPKKLAGAATAEVETPAMPANPPDDWLTYHLLHPGPEHAGDPNCAFYWEGLYHLHYIYKHSIGSAYAHVSSTDMVHWKWHPTTLFPKTTGHGMFSGTGFFTKDGKPAIIYHGQRTGRNQIAIAEDNLLEKWTKPWKLEPNIRPDQDGSKIAHWDPDAWIDGDNYYALSGGRPGTETPLPPTLLKSSDLKNWNYLGLFMTRDMPGVQANEDISCPNFFRLGNKFMILCISHKLGCRYYLGEWKNEQYTPDFHARMSWNGNHFFAPESVLTKDKRRVMWAWLNHLPIAPGGVQSLPRELELPEDGVLRIKPLKELESLRYDRNQEEGITVKSDTLHPLKKISGNTLELEVAFEASAAKEYGLDVLCDDTGTNGVRVAYLPESKTLKVGKVNAPFELKPGETLALRVFIDKNLVEVFANERQAAVAAGKYVPENLGVNLFSKGGNAVVKNISAWKMKSIYATP